MNRRRLSCALVAVGALLATYTATPAAAEPRTAPAAAPSPAPLTTGGDKVGRDDPRHGDLWDAKQEHGRDGNPASTTMIDYLPISGFSPGEQALIMKIVEFALGNDKYADFVRVGELTSPKSLDPELRKAVEPRFTKVDKLWVPDKSLIMPMSATNTPNQFHAEFNAQRLYSYVEYAMRMIAATRGGNAADLNEAARREIWEREIREYQDELAKLAKKSKGWEKRYIERLQKGIAHNGTFPPQGVRMPQAGLLDNQSCGSRSGTRCSQISPEADYHNLYDRQVNIQLAASRTGVMNTQDALDELYERFKQGDVSSAEVEGLVKAVEGNMEAARAGVAAKVKANAPAVAAERVGNAGQIINSTQRFQRSVARLPGAAKIAASDPVRQVEAAQRGLGETKAKPANPAAAKGWTGVQNQAKSAPATSKMASAYQAKDDAKKIMGGEKCPPEQPGGALGAAGARPMAAPAAGVLAAPGACTVGKAPPSGLEKSLEAAANGKNGGIDFRSLELRYLSDKPGDGANAFNYSFTAKRAASYGDQHIEEGLANARQASDAFFVWLSMSPETYWVNLNPDEPDRVIDEKLGRTDVGRVMLEADLRMKKTVGELIHPKKKSGKRFWDEMRGDCFSFRNWIVPGEAEVYADGDELYIVDAPLKVMSEAQYLKSEGAGGIRPCKMDKAAEEHNEAMYHERILPKLEKAVNEAPEYEQLRRVYLSRVAAEWYRRRDRQHPTGYGSLIDTNDVSRWRYEGDWKPKDTFDAYVDSYKNGEFDIKTKTRKGNYIYTRTYVYGGVDWTRLNFQSMDKAEFERARPGLAARIGKSFGGQAAGRSGDKVWVGGSVPVRSAEQSQDTGGVPLTVYLGILAVVVLGIGGLVFWGRRAGAR